jgi:hypothetical protein
MRERYRMSSGSSQLIYNSTRDLSATCHRPVIDRPVSGVRPVYGVQSVSGVISMDEILAPGRIISPFGYTKPTIRAISGMKNSFSNEYLCILQRYPKQSTPNHSFNCITIQKLYLLTILVLHHSFQFEHPLHEPSVFR